MGKKPTKPRGYNKLKQSLLDNLQARGLVEDVYTDMVQNYMDLWERRQQLRADIEERGVSIMDTKRGMPVENRSVSLEAQVSAQMLRLYTALGFKDLAAAGAKAGGDPDDEL